MEEAAGTNLYAYVGNHSINDVDPQGLISAACLKALLELEAAIAALEKRIQQRRAGLQRGETYDPGHDQSIEQAKNRVRNAMNSVENACNCHDQKQLAEKVAIAAGLLALMAVSRGKIPGLPDVPLLSPKSCPAN